jgi:hypothetical protein
MAPRKLKREEEKDSNQCSTRQMSVPVFTTNNQEYWGLKNIQGLNILEYIDLRSLTWQIFPLSNTILKVIKLIEGNILEMGSVSIFRSEAKADFVAETCCYINCITFNFPYDREVHQANDFQCDAKSLEFY